MLLRNIIYKNSKSFLFSNHGYLCWDVLVVLCMDLGLMVVIFFDLLHLFQNILCTVVGIWYKFCFALQTAAGLTFLLTYSFLAVLLQCLLLPWRLPIYLSTCKPSHCGSLLLFLFGCKLFSFCLDSMCWLYGWIVAFSWASRPVVKDRLFLFLVRWYYGACWWLKFISFSLACRCSTNVDIWGSFE